MVSVAVIANGGANLASLRFAFERLGAAVTIAAHPHELRQATHIVLPGVGAAPDAMQRLHEAGFVETFASLSKPVLGICLGMQLLFDSSAEGDVQCLQIIPGRAERLHSEPGLPVPHMGWNTMSFDSGTPLLEQLTPGRDRTYFVHSYAAPRGAFTIAHCDYGISFSACVRRENFFGVQFHPERSGAAGARVLQNFLRMPCS